MMQNNGSDLPEEQNGRLTPVQQSPPQPLQPAAHWVPMTYPPALMVPFHPYAAYHHYYQQNPYGRGRGRHAQQNQASNRENKTIWVGELDHWMDENYLHHCFTSFGEIASIKVIRNKHTGLSEGYGFVEFPSHETAERVLQHYSRAPTPDNELPFRLNWAAFSTGDKRPDNSPELSIFVGDLAADVTDRLLHETFSSKYPSVKAAKVVVDPNTGRSKGYGFVRFGDDDERTKAMAEMNGVYCSSRRMRIGAATPRKSNGYHQQGGYPSNGPSSQSDRESANTTIFVGGLDPNVSVDDLKKPFAQFGEIVSVKIPVGKGCGFVQFANRSNAEEALEKLNGTVIGEQPVRLFWGRNAGNKHLRPDFGNQWSGAYYGGQFYDGCYGYGMASPGDPMIYAPVCVPYQMYS